MSLDRVPNLWCDEPPIRVEPKSIRRQRAPSVWPPPHPPAHQIRVVKFWSLLPLPTYPPISLRISIIVIKIVHLRTCWCSNVHHHPPFYPLLTSGKDLSSLTVIITKSILIKIRAIVCPGHPSSQVIYWESIVTKVTLITQVDLRLPWLPGFTVNCHDRGCPGCPHVALMLP